jgi:hypothetical protein
MAKALLSLFDKSPEALAAQVTAALAGMLDRSIIRVEFQPLNPGKGEYYRVLITHDSSDVTLTSPLKCNSFSGNRVIDVTSPATAFFTAHAGDFVGPLITCTISTDRGPEEHAGLVFWSTDATNAPLAWQVDGPGLVGNTLFTSTGGTTPRSAADRAGDFFNVKEAGAIGDGVADDTVAIDWARENHDAIVFPPGNYLYSGDGLEMDGLRIRGYGDCTITLGNGKTLIVGNDTVEICQLRDINIDGGFGAIRHTGTGVYVRNGVWIENVRFTNYTGAAISNNAADWPYWRIDGCVFYGANDTATMGIALSGDNAGSVIRRCAFLNNAIHIKHRGNGHNIYLENNDFVRFTAYGAAPRIDLWIVPSTIDTSDALIARGNKFGPENLAAAGQDYRVLFADEGAGSENALRMPSADESSGKIVNAVFSGNTQGGSGSSTPPFVTTRTKVIFQLQVTDHIINGTRPATAVHIEPSVSASDYLSTGNIVSFAPSWNNLPQTPDVQVLACNKPGFFRLLDPYAQVNDPAEPLPYTGASAATGFVDMIPTSDSSAIPTAGGYSIGAETDALGGADAAAVTAAGDGSVYFGLGTAVTVGRPLWIEFDVKSSGVSPVDIIAAKLVFNGVQGKFNRNIQLTADWRRIRIPHIPMAADVNQVSFQVPGHAGTFSIGRVRVYHANEPQVGGHRPTITTADELIAYLASAGLIVDGT